MAALREIDLLRAKKQLLIAKSEIYRQSIHLECLRVQASTSWIERTIQLIRRTYPLLILAATLAGFFTARKKRSLKNIWAKGFLGYQLFRRLRPLVEQWLARKHQAPAD